MKRRHVYLVLAVIGAVVPYWFFLEFLRAHGLNGMLLIQQLFGTPISSFFAADLLISAVVFVFFLRTEAARLSIESRWPYIVALLTVGLSFALPLFLYARERRLEAGA